MKALLQQALDALCKSFPTTGMYEEELECKHRQAIQALRQELAKPEPEPVAYMTSYGNVARLDNVLSDHPWVGKEDYTVPLFTKEQL